MGSDGIADYETLLIAAIITHAPKYYPMVCIELVLGQGLPMKIPNVDCLQQVDCGWTPQRKSRELKAVTSTRSSLCLMDLKENICYVAYSLCECY